MAGLALYINIATTTGINIEIPTIKFVSSFCLFAIE